VTEDRPFDWPDHWLPALDALRRRVASLCVRWGKDGATADDVFQDTLVKVILAAREEAGSAAGATRPSGRSPDPSNSSPGRRASR
jgi:hypothetical protein